MKEFTSCFIGIPLPDENLEELSLLQKEVNTLNPSLEMDNGIPHLTVYYLDKQTEDNLEEIRKIVEENVQTLRGSDLKIGGVNTFGDDAPWVLFLPVIYTDSLVEFNKNISQEVSEFMLEDNNLPFHPHMTVARFNSTAQESWEKSKLAVGSEMEKINWQFPITEVVIFGADSPTEHYKKLITIPV